MRSREGMVEMIAVARSVAPHLLISTSTTAAREIVEVSDYVLLHLNDTSLEGIPEMLEAGLVYGKPVVVNEDDKLGYEGAEAARLSVEHGAGWGFMNSPANQRVPFEFEGAVDDPIVYDMMRRLTTPGARVEPVALDELHALITDPYDGHVARAGSTLPVTAAVTGARSSEVHEAVFYVGGTFYGHIIGRNSSAPWRIEWADIPAGRHDRLPQRRARTNRCRSRSRN
jgi:hypothetical protein